MKASALFFVAMSPGRLRNGLSWAGRGGGASVALRGQSCSFWAGHHFRKSKMQRLAWFRNLNILLSLAGVVIFGAALVVLVTAPDRIDRMVQDFAVSQVSDRFQETIAAHQLEDRAGRLKGLAEGLAERFSDSIEAQKARLEAGFDKFVADVLTAGCKIDCDRQAAVREDVTAFFEGVLQATEERRAQIETFIETEYDEVLAELRRDLKIFCASNLMVFLMALALAVFKGRAGAHLLPISVLLSVATVIATYFYVFNQNWLWTIVFNDYWGWSYLGFVGVLFAFLMDIAFNRGRITTRVINFFCHLVGAAVAVFPC